MVSGKHKGRTILIAVIALFLLSGCNTGNYEEDLDNSVIRAADRMRSGGNTSGAISIYRRALEKAKDNNEKLTLCLKLGDALIENGQLTEASRVFEQALDIDHDDQAKKRLARCYLLAGKPDPVMTICQEILAENTNDADVYNLLGVACDLKADHKQAQYNYHKALALSPDDVNVRGNLGLSLAFSENYEEAFQWLAPLGERIGATAKQRHNLAMAYALSGQWNKARDLFSKELDPQAVEGNLHILRGVQLTQIPKGDFQE